MLSLKHCLIFFGFLLFTENDFLMAIKEKKKRHIFSSHHHSSYGDCSDSTFQEKSKPSTWSVLRINSFLQQNRNQNSIIALVIFAREESKNPFHHQNTCKPISIVCISHLCLENFPSKPSSVELSLVFLKKNLGIFPPYFYLQWCDIFIWYSGTIRNNEVDKGVSKQKCEVKYKYFVSLQMLLKCT